MKLAIRHRISRLDVERNSKSFVAGRFIVSMRVRSEQHIWKVLSKFETEDEEEFIAKTHKHVERVVLLEGFPC